MRETETLLEQIRNEARLLRVYATAMRQHAKMYEAAHLVARLAAETFDTPMANVSLLYEDRQAVIAGVGIEDGAFIAIEQTYCQHLLVTRDVMAIDDSTQDHRVNSLDATVKDGIRTYLGAPLLSDGQVIGSLCVYDTQIRDWAPEEMELIGRLADSLMGVDQQMKRSHNEPASA